MTEPDRITAPTHNQTLVADGVSQLYLQFQGLPVIAGILTSWLQQCQELEDALWALFTLNLSNAVGTWLDGFGRVLGFARPVLATTSSPLADDPYRQVLQAVILANRSSGTLPQLGAIVALLWGATGGTPPYTMTEYFPAAIEVDPAGAIGITGAVAILVLRKARMGGVGLYLVDPSTSGGAFTCAPGERVMTDSTEGFGDCNSTGDPATATTGGYLVWMIQ